MGRKLWVSPVLPFLKDRDATSHSVAHRSITEYLRGHVGYWLRFQGTTDANGHLVVTHNCGFKPTAAFVTQQNATGVTHEMGPFHIHEFDESTIDIHFFRKSGQDSDNVVHAGFILLMPDTGEN